jgi:hypothetical protein
LFTWGVYCETAELTPFGCLLIFLEESLGSFFLKTNIIDTLSSKKIEHSIKANQLRQVINLMFRLFWVGLVDKYR